MSENSQFPENQVPGGLPVTENQVDTDENKPLMGSQSPTICALPWTHLFFNNLGHLHACCMGEYFDKGVVDEAGQNFKAHKKGDLSKAFNSQYMKDLRLQMMRGEKPKICYRCFNDEDSGLKSYRQSQNEIFNEVVEQINSNTSDQGDVPFSVKFIDARLGNLCNLRCRMCNPIASKKWIEDWKKIYPGDLSEERSKELTFLDWYERDEFWENLEVQIPFLENLHLAGGEPLLIKKSFDFLKKVIEMDRAKDISLTYNTNFTELPKPCFELWPKFKSVTLMVSLDGFGDLNHYIRYPADWSKIESNFKIIKKQFYSLGLEPVKLIITIQAYNFLHLTPLLEFMLKYWRYINPRIHFNILTDPHYFSVQVLPLELKELGIDRLKDFIEKRSRGFVLSYQKKQIYTQLKESIESLEEFIFKEDKSEMFKEFIDHTRKMDSIRGQNVVDVIPEFKDYFESTGEVRP